MKRAVIGLLVGSATALLMLGLGGRLAMRGYALATARPPAFSIAGTVRYFVAVSIGGAGAGLLFGLLRPRIARWPAPLAGLAFGIGLFAILLPGMRPPGPGGTLLFLLLFAAFGASLDICWGFTLRRMKSSVP